MYERPLAVMVSRFPFPRRAAKTEELSTTDTNPHKQQRHEQRTSPSFPLFRRRRPSPLQQPTLTQQQTRVVPMMLHHQLQQQQREEGEGEPNVLNSNNSNTTSSSSSTTANPKHAPRFLCGCGGVNAQNYVHEEPEDGAMEWDPLHSLPEDPSVQESIECIVAATQGDLLDVLQRQYDQDPYLLPTPTGLQQSILRNRRSNTAYPQRSVLPPALDTIPMAVTPPPIQCNCCTGQPPSALPSDWPQRPLLLRPTPGSGTKVIGIRFARDDSAVDNAATNKYLWQPGQKQSWPQALAQHWGHNDAKTASNNCCAECVILPMNNGTEPPGQALVTDFETPHFTGTLLVRIRDCTGTTDPQAMTGKGYFDGLNRRYQVVIRGRFKEARPWTECLTGFR